MGYAANAIEPSRGGTARATTRRDETPPAARRERLGLAATLGASLLRYPLLIFPSVARELSRRRVRAEQIQDATLRRLALAALGKRGNMEGAALLAVLAPPARRIETIRALVAFQAVYNHLDVLTEQPCSDPVANGRQLHQALLAALDRDAPYADDHALDPRGEDGGYLLELIEACRACLAALPSYPLAAPSVRAAAERIVSFQSLNLGERQGSHDGLRQWATAQTPPESGLRWWETAAAAGSSLGVHAMIALAAGPTLDPRELARIDNAYFPWIGALHSLLDSTVDVAEDRQDAQRNLLAYYASPAEATLRMELLATRAGEAARTLGAGRQHEAILLAMASYYLSAPEAATSATRGPSRAVARALGSLMGPSLTLFRAARLASRLVRG
jgi:tetraprenyl-beta-curcumene synthase